MKAEEKTLLALPIVAGTSKRTYCTTGVLFPPTLFAHSRHTDGETRYFTDWFIKRKEFANLSDGSSCPLFHFFQLIGFPCPYSTCPRVRVFNPASTMGNVTGACAADIAVKVFVSTNYA